MANLDEMVVNVGKRVSFVGGELCVQLHEEQARLLEAHRELHLQSVIDSSALLNAHAFSAHPLRVALLEHEALELALIRRGAT